MEQNLNNSFPEHYRSFLNALNNHNVEYLIIGGYAMGAYGYVRSTTDLDIYINADVKNASKMINACISYGIPKEDLKLEMFLVPKMVGIGKPPLRIEVLKKLGSVDFQYAFQRANKKNIDGTDINVISLEDLILLKKDALKDRSTLRDQEDLSYLEKFKKMISGNKDKGN
jgi:predicted nucleotidyltransferase